MRNIFKYSKDISLRSIFVKKNYEERIKAINYFDHFLYFQLKLCQFKKKNIINNCSQEHPLIGPFK